MYSTAHQNPCDVLAGFSCAHFNNSPTSHDKNTHWVNMCICTDPISHPTNQFGTYEGSGQPVAG